MWIVGEGRTSEPRSLASRGGKWFILSSLHCNINIVYLENGLSYKLQERAQVLSAHLRACSPMYMYHYNLHPDQGLKHLLSPRGSRSVFKWWYV